MSPARIVVLLLSVVVVCCQVCYSVRLRDDNALLSTPELIAKAGYPVELHNVTTEDGYILTHHRIPPHGRWNSSNVSSSSPSSAGVVLLEHGLLGSSADWIVKGAPDALGYVLADNGYDVWLLNTRGNIYSERHTKWDPLYDRTSFWDFSWHQMGIYDLPNTIDYVLNATNNSKLYHIGHSQGTTVLFVMLSERPEYNDKLHTHISYSPIAFHKHTINFMFKVLQPIEAIGGLAALKFFIGDFNFAPRPIFISYLTAQCQDHLKTQFLCSGLYYSLMGYNPPQMNSSLLPMIYGHFPAGSSMKQMAHYIQEMNSGRFRKFDYGVDGNLRAYNQTYPPDYNCSNIQIPISTFYGGKDSFAQLPDVNKFHKLLPNLKHKIFIPNWAHMDFLFGIDAKPIIYDKTLKLLKEFRLDVV